MIRKSVAEILDDHVTFELQGYDTTSIERCRELLRAEGTGLSDYEIPAIRDLDRRVGPRPDRHLHQSQRQRMGSPGRCRSTRFDPGLVEKWISFEINALA